MNWYTMIRNALEILYFVSGIVIAAVAFTAIFQLKFTKAQLEESKAQAKNEALRDSLKLSSELCAKYLTEIIQKANIIDEIIEKHEIKSLSNAEVSFEKNSIRMKNFNPHSESDKLEHLHRPFLDFANAAEAFSLPIIQMVADEESVFVCVGETHCSSIKNILPLLLIAHDGGTAFTNTLKLYSLWRKKLETRSLIKQQEDIERKLKSNRFETITPLGV